MPLQSIEDSFAVDSSGFSASSYVLWFDVKHGNNEGWHDWLMMHLICGTRTHIVASVEMSGATANDSPYFKPLVEQTAKAGFNLREVSADKGYIRMKNLQATIDVGAVPFIPFKANAQADRGTTFGRACFTSTTSSAPNSWPTITNARTWKRPFR